MGRNSKSVALWVAKSAFEGLAPLLSENGVTVPEVEKLLRAVSIHAMAKQLQNGRRLLNDSQLAIRIGVDRHDVAKLLKRTPLEGVHVSAGRATVMRVIQGWKTECLAQGRRRELAVGGFHSAGSSVWSLVRRYAPGIYPRGIIDEMIRLKLVRPVANGQLRLADKSLLRTKPNAHNLEQAAQKMRDMMRAIFHDLAKPGAEPVLQEVQSEQIDVVDLALARKMLADRLGATMDRIAEELNSPRLLRGSSTRRRVRLGALGMIVEEVLAKESDNESNGGTKDVRQKKKKNRLSRVTPDKVRTR